MNEKPINPLQYGYYKEEMETHCQSLQLFYQQEARHRVGHWSDANVKLLSPQRMFKQKYELIMYRTLLVGHRMQKR